MRGRLETGTFPAANTAAPSQTEGQLWRWSPFSFPLSRPFLGPSVLTIGYLLPKGCVGANRKLFPETPGSFEVGWFRHQTEMRHLYPLPPEVLGS